MYERIVAQALMTPWALESRYMSIVSEILAFRARGGRLGAEEVKARIDAGPSARRSSSTVGPGAGMIAVIPICGVIAHRTFDASSGMTSTDEIGAMIRSAVANPDVSTLLYDGSTPGGTVTGVPELAAEMLKARKQKYTVASANGDVGSAGYWLLSQADEFVMIPSAEVGSIGVWTMHQDWTEALAKEGIKITAISAGDYKVELAPWNALTDDAKANLQASVDDCYSQFLAAVAKGRGTNVTNVKKNYGQGRMLDSGAALAAGMVDAIETFPQTIARLASGKTFRGQPISGATVADRVAVPTPAAIDVAERDYRDSRISLAERT